MYERLFHLCQKREKRQHWFSDSIGWYPAGSPVQMPSSLQYDPHYYTTATPVNGPCPGLPGWAGTKKVKPIWIYWSKR